jgi:hypothetical protein
VGHAEQPVSFQVPQGHAHAVSVTGRRGAADDDGAQSSPGKLATFRSRRHRHLTHTQQLGIGLRFNFLTRQSHGNTSDWLHTKASTSPYTLLRVMPYLHYRVATKAALEQAAAQVIQAVDYSTGSAG